MRETVPAAGSPSKPLSATSVFGLPATKEHAVKRPGERASRPTEMATGSDAEPTACDGETT